MSTQIPGLLDILNEAFKPTIQLYGHEADNMASIYIGGGKAGRLFFKDGNGNVKCTILSDAQVASLTMLNAAFKQVVGLSAQNGGHLILSSPLGNNRITLDGETGDIKLWHPAGTELFSVEGATGAVRAADIKGHGSLAMAGTSGKEVFKLDANLNNVTFKNAAEQVTIYLSGQDGDLKLTGDLELKDGTSLEDGTYKDRVRLRAATGGAYLGGSGVGGNLSLFPDGVPNVDDAAEALIHLDGQTGTVHLKQNKNSIITLEPAKAGLRLGGRTVAGGDITLYQKKATAYDVTETNKANIHLDGEAARIRLGGHNAAAELALFPEGTATNNLNDFSNAAIHLDGKLGDITLKNADCAEEFDLAHELAVEPGTVMVLSQEGKVRSSSTAYDKKVVGVVSGAGDLRPGIILDKKKAHDRVPIALVGKVYCKVEAKTSPIGVGDLLTTSNMPGHAMRASDALQAFGAVLGKALGPMGKGSTGLIPILVTLQ